MSRDAVRVGLEDPEVFDEEDDVVAMLSLLLCLLPLGLDPSPACVCSWRNDGGPIVVR